MESNFIKIVLVGETGVGKSQILNTYCFGLGPGESRDPTVGCDYVLKRVIINNQFVKLQIWDIAGAEYDSQLMKIYLRGALGVIFVCDAEHESTKHALIRWRNQVQQYADEYNGRQIPFLVVQNKSDLRSGEGQQSLGYLQQFAASNGFLDAIQTSAYDNYRLAEAFEILVEEIIRRDLIQLQMKRNASKINKLQIQDSQLSTKQASKCF